MMVSDRNDQLSIQITNHQLLLRKKRSIAQLSVMRHYHTPTPTVNDDEKFLIEFCLKVSTRLMER